MVLRHGERFERYLVGEPASFPEPGQWFSAFPHRPGAPVADAAPTVPLWIGEVPFTPARRAVLDELLSVQDPRLPRVIARFAERGVLVVAARVARPMEVALEECVPLDRVGLALDVAAELLELLPRLPIRPSLSEGTVGLADDGGLVVSGWLDGARVEPGRAVGRALVRWTGAELHRFPTLARTVERLAASGDDLTGARAAILGALRREGLRALRRSASRVEVRALPAADGRVKVGVPEGKMGRDDDEPYDPEGGPTVVFDAKGFVAGLPRPLAPAAPRDVASEASRLRHVFTDDQSGGAPTAVPDGDAAMELSSVAEISPAGAAAPLAGGPSVQNAGPDAGPDGGLPWAPQAPVAFGSATRPRVKPGDDPIFRIAPYLVGAAVVVLVLWLGFGR